MLKTALLLLAISLVASSVHAAEPTPYDWGPVIKTFEVASEGDYKGTFVRRGTSNVYDAEWIFVPTKQKIVDVLEVRGILNGELIIHRRGNNGTYTMPIKNGVMGRGKASWVSDPGFFWEAAALPASAAPAAAAPTVTAPAAAPPAPSAPAEKKARWLVVKTKDGAMGYDAGSIKPGPRAGTTSVISGFYTTKGLSGDGLKWKYEFIDAEYDCAAKTYTLMTRALHNDVGESVHTILPKKDRAEWQPTATSPYHTQVFSLACDKQTLKGAREVGSYANAVKALKVEALGAAAAAAEDKALAKEWWVVSKSGDGAWGYDVKSVKAGSTPKHTFVQFIIYASKPVKNPSGDWSFLLSDAEFNCTAKTYTTKGMSIFDAAGKSLAIAQMNDERPLPQAGVHVFLHKLVCEKGVLQDARDVGGLGGLFDGLKEVAR
jgi:hypothetical protein